MPKWNGVISSPVHAPNENPLAFAQTICLPRCYLPSGSRPFNVHGLAVHLFPNLQSAKHFCSSRPLLSSSPSCVTTRQQHRMCLHPRLFARRCNTCAKRESRHFFSFFAHAPSGKRVRVLPRSMFFFPLFFLLRQPKQVKRDQERGDKGDLI